MLSPLTFPLDRVVDAEGRPLFEGRASREMQAIAPLEHAVCPYAGSRFKHEQPMNVSGLRQMRNHWGDVLAGLGYLRGLYPEPASPTRYIDLWRLCNLGELLTPFLLYRRDDPVPNGQLPAPVAGLFKVVIGLSHAARELAFASLFQAAEKIDEALDHDQLYAFVEERGLFVGPTEVCAGPEPMIREVIDTLKEKPAKLDPKQKKKLCINDEEAFLRFAYCQMNGIALGFLFTIIADALYSRIHRALWPEGEREGLALPADPQPGFLAGVDPAIAQAMLHGIVGIAISDHGGRLNEAARLAEPFGDGKPHPQLAGALGRYAEVGGVVDDVARYLHLEKIGSGLSQTLKMQCLAALGLEDSVHLNAIAREFSPPTAKLRSLLQVMFGLQILPNLKVQADGRTMMALGEDAPWS